MNSGNYTTTWADLDESNKAHYGRGYPLAIHNAGNELQKALAKYNQELDMLCACQDTWYESVTSEASLDRQELLFGYVVAARREFRKASNLYDIISRRYDRIYAKWMSENLVVDHYNRLAQDIADSADVREMSQP